MSNVPPFVAKQRAAYVVKKDLGPRPGADGLPVATQVPEAIYVYQNARYLEFDFSLDNTASPAIFFQLAGDIHRNYLIIQNNSAAIMYVSFTGQTGNFITGLQIPVGQCYEPNVPPRGSFALSGLGAGVVITGSCLA